jgi:hypothetical protein
MLAMFDVGSLVGAPIVGGVLQCARHTALPAYPTMFVGVATGLVGVALIFAAGTRRGEARGNAHSSPDAALAQSEGALERFSGKPACEHVFGELSSPSEPAADYVPSAIER